MRGRRFVEYQSLDRIGPHRLACILPVFNRCAPRALALSRTRPILAPSSPGESDLMRRFIVGFFTVVGLIVVLLVVGGAIAWRVLVPPAPGIAGSTILSLE